MKSNENIISEWNEVKLGDVCSIQTGKWDANHASKDGKYRFYTCAYEFAYCDTKRFENESLILPGNGANVGEVFYYNGEFDAYQRTYVLNHIKINAKYLYYHLVRNWKRRNSDKQFGSATNYIRMGNFTDYEVSYPPLSEQKLIVSKLEELFSKLDNGVESLKKLQQQLKVYRQAVLKWAFEGRLTNANVKDGELPKGWIRAELGNYIDTIGAGKSFKCDERPPRSSEIGVLKVSAVTWDEFDEEESKTVIDDTMVNKNYFVKDGDFLFSRANTIELVGACVLVKQIKKQLMLSDKTLRLKFKSSLDKTYALYYLRSFIGKKQIQILSTGNQESMRNIGQAKIKQIEIVLPESTTRQNEVVQEIESRLSVCDKIEETIVNGLKESEALRQSILKQAFEGKLI